jgi:endonuclease YncB( thermonuclease family)
MSDKALATTSYKTLVKTLKQEIQATGEKLKQTIETEKVGVYWRMGKHIHTHLLEHKERAEYGKELFPRLSAELTMDESLLYRMVKFYNAFPNLATRPNLSWSHYKELLPIKDREKRREYVEKIKEDSLSVRELRELIADEEQKQVPVVAVEASPKREKLSLLRGVPFVYKIKRIDCLKPENSRQVVDCGFNIFTGVDIDNLSDFSPDQTVLAKKTNNRYTLQKTDVPINRIYTYKAYVEKVLDGDTLWAVLDLGFKIFIRQKIRLHRIDAPPLETDEGLKAMNYLNKKLKPLDFIVVKTHWRDKFDRYLADILYLPDEPYFLAVTEKGKYLNQELADKGYCRIVPSQ